jgi:dienelactone hydrolase
MKLDFFLLILCLPLLGGRYLSAQGNRDSLRNLGNRYYRLTNLKMSDDGRWLTVRKAYDLSNDTVLIFYSSYTNHPVAYRSDVRRVVFLRNGNLLIQKSNQVELFNPKEQKSPFYNGIKQMQIFGSKVNFVLHYNNDSKSRLEIRDDTGVLINAIDSVFKYYITENDCIFAITEGKKGNHIITSLKEGSTEKVYETPHKITGLEADPGGQSILVFEKTGDNSSQEVIYLDLSNKTRFLLKDVLPTRSVVESGKVISEGKAIFLTLLLPGTDKDSSMVDIWYGNDNNLDNKFYPSDREINYLWQPKEKKLVQIGNDSLTTNLNIGSDRYFLSFNINYLEDYTLESTPIQLKVYDRVQHEYSVLDTINDCLYLSCSGYYAVSAKNKKWYLYNIPARSKKLISAEGLANPWFTDDGTAVIFEGEGAIWRYELQSDLLLKEAVFRGYETSIVNGKIEVIDARKGNFRKQFVNSKEPYIIKLYDPQENMTSYVLRNKGKSRVIVPLTSHYIQFLNYNKSYDRFSWVEEDYNMPPQLVSKAEGKERKVLYISNNADRPILSLKQEIISYSKRDNIPMKGILYYPLNYYSSVKYPMIVSVYERQRQFSNLYLSPSYYNDIGFNIRLFLEKGYFVYLPDILIQGKSGTGMDALDCVNRALDAISENAVIDKQKIGLIGHSFGVYETDFIATHSNRFAAYISGSGTSDIIWAHHSFNYNFLWPEYRRVETGQYKMRVSFSADKLLYLENNPVYYADKVNAPVLLWAGRKDKNIPSDNTMSLYNALRRNGKTVVALFYKDEGHVMQNPKAQIDLTSRVLDWFDYFLKGDTGIEWIKKGM